MISPTRFGQRRISVVIPTYDRLRLLSRALDSVAAQSRKADEIVVVDDGSRDGTERFVLETYPEVRLLRQENRGVSAARNAGIRAATGGLIAFLDSDDEWLPRKLERQLEAMDASPESRLCHTDEIWIRDGRRVNPMKKHQKFGGWIFDKALPLCVISPSSVVVDRSLFDDVGLFDEDLPACEDYDLWLRICARFPVLFVEERLIVKHGGHQDQLSRRHWGMDRFRIQALRKILAEGDLREDYRRSAEAMLARKVEIFSRGAEKRGRRAGLRGMIRFVVALAPEADALVRRYRMEPREGAFRWFRSEEAALVVSGVGKIAAAAAASYLHAMTGEEPLGVWLNFGTAGHRDRPRGDVLLAHTVVDAASGLRFYPPRLGGPKLDAVELRTVDRPESELDSSAAYDMEAYGFVATAIRFSTAELVQAIKIVSDNRESTTAAWTAAAVRDLVESRIENVASAAEYFRETAKELDPLRREESESRALVSAYSSRAHFTASETRRLRRLLQRWAALAPEDSRETASGRTASDILEGLERRVHALALERSL